MSRTRRGGRKYQLCKLVREYKQGAAGRLPLGIEGALAENPSARVEVEEATTYLPWKLIPITFA